MYHPALTDHQRRAAILPGGFTAEDFSRRRQRVFEHIGSGLAVVFGGLTPQGSVAFRQTNDFYYLCGVEAPHAILCLEGRRQRTTLYLPPRDDTHERWDGPSLSCQDADLLKSASAVDDVREPASLHTDLQGAAAIWTPFAESEGPCMYQDTLRAARQLIDADPWSAQPSLEAYRRNLLEQRTGATIKDLSPCLADLRKIKDAHELHAMRRAGTLCARAAMAAMAHTAPGVYEYELAAVAEHVYRIGGARGPSYRAIVPGGANIWHTHYYRNDCVLKDGDLVLFDCAPDLDYYTSDIGRYWPVNGRYTPRQRRLYDLVVTYHRVLLEEMAPGRTPRAIHDDAARRMRPVMAKMTFENEAEQRGVEAMLAFPKLLTHGVGMTVHDHPLWPADDPLPPGVVIAVDPQMWIPEEKIYFRCEDTVAVTADGIENFTAEAPLDPDAIEHTLQTSPRKAIGV